jgi:hypothetical protein
VSSTIRVTLMSNWFEFLRSDRDDR